MRLLCTKAWLSAMLVGFLAIEGPLWAAPNAFQTLVSTRSTSVSTDTGPARINFNILSDVGTIGKSSIDLSKPGVAELLQELATASIETPWLYRYTYVFENNSTVSLKLSFSDPRIANSPLFEAFNDYSLSLDPGETRTVQFLTVHAPDFVVSPVNNSIWDYRSDRWDILGSGPASLYVPAWTGPTFIEPQ
jgi:hypothetical protein